MKESGSCMVNMSRMTGRKDLAAKSVDWGNINIMDSISYVRRPITKKIDIGVRKRQRVMRKGTINSSEVYDYDYRVLKPRGGAVDFGSVKGRAHKTKT